MGYAVVHMQKIKAGAVGGIQSHNNREHLPRTNPDVDPLRSWRNYDIIPCDNYKRAIKENLSNLVKSNRAVRKDAVVLCNFVVTSDHETMEAMEPEHQRELFKDSVKWFCDRYGADRVINATVHEDETTSHLHVGIMPITKNGRLSAKAIFTKTEMKAIQTEFARDVGAKYGLERGVEGSERTHLSVARFKEKQALDMANEFASKANEFACKANDLETDIQERKQELSEADKRLRSLSNEVKSAKEDLNALQGKLEPLREDIDKYTRRLKSLKFQCEAESKAVDSLKEKKMDLEGKIEALQATLTTSEVESITYEKNIFGGVKGVTSKELDALKRTAAQVDTMRAERDHALSRATQAEERAVSAENRAKSAYDDANQQLRQKIREVEQDRPSMQMYRENAKLKRENDSLKNLFSFVMEQLETHFPQVFRIIEPQVRKKKQSRTNPEHSTVGRSWEHER